MNSLVFLKETVSALPSARTEFLCIIYRNKFKSSNIFDEYMCLRQITALRTRHKRNLLCQELPSRQLSFAIVTVNFLTSAIQMYSVNWQVGETAVSVSEKHTDGARTATAKECKIVYNLVPCDVRSAKQWNLTVYFELVIFL